MDRVGNSMMFSPEVPARPKVEKRRAIVPHMCISGSKEHWERLCAQDREEHVCISGKTIMASLGKDVSDRCHACALLCGNGGQTMKISISPKG
jgi:hypothetical protein